MITLLLFLVGVLVGVGGEQLWSRARDGRETQATGPDGVSPAKRRWRPARIALITLGVLVVFALVALVAGYLYADSQFKKIETVPVGGELAGSPTGTNYLLVGTDNRPGEPGNRSDTMLVLRTDDGPARLMSIPRDLLVEIPGRNGRHRINAAYNDGPASLLRTVQQSVGIPIDRYLEINFVSFGGLVDAVGGVTINFENPAFDTKSGLDVKQAGPVTLNGEQALAYVRSRTYTEVVDGQERRDGTADLGRVKRQQVFLRSVLAEAGRSRNPFTMAKIGRSLTNGLKIDDDMTLFDALRFAWRMGRLDPQQVELPTDIVGPALELKQPDAGPVITSFGGG